MLPSLNARCQLITAMGLALAVLFCFLVAAPLLRGDFLLDDYPNLMPLGLNGGIHSWEEARFFIFGNESGVLGRPVSMATFLLNGQDWPPNPWSFKYTNLLLHLLNMLLVFWLVAVVLVRQQRIQFSSRQWLAIALLSSLLWGLAPVHQMVVAEVVQRMTSLAGTFVLLFLLSWLAGRDQLAQVTRVWQVFRIPQLYLAGLFLLLGMLSKESAVLGVGYLLVIEYGLMGKARTSTLFQHLRRVLLVVYLAGLGLIWIRYGLLSSAWEFREFSLWERALTELRMLWLSLRQIVLPSPSLLGLFQDDVVISRGIFQPWTTLLALLGHLGLLALAFSRQWRQRSMGVLALAVAYLWFLSGHALESTVLPLEIYFEHRNYLPSLGVIVLLATGLVVGVSHHRVLVVLIVGYIAGIALIAHQNAKVWGSTDTLARVLEAEKPYSVRAQQYLATYYYYYGDYEKTLAIMSRIDEQVKRMPGNYLQTLFLHCLVNGKVPAVDMEVMKVPVWDGATRASLENLHEYLNQHTCEGLDHQKLLEITETVVANPAFRKAANYFLIVYQLGEIKWSLGRREEALADFVRAYEHHPDAWIAIRIIETLATFQRFEDAQVWAERAEKQHRHMAGHFRHVQQVLQEDIRKRDAGKAEKPVAS